MDPTAVLTRSSRSETKRSSTTTPSRRRHFGRYAILAAAALLAGLLVWGLTPITATTVSAEQLVREARDVVERGGDRLYRVETMANATARPRLPMLALSREVRLWTRGDRFWVENRSASGKVWSWGRDEQGHYWLAATPELGLEFESHEVPDWVARSADLCSLRLETLLSDLLIAFDLIREPMPDGWERIGAIRKLGQESAPVRRVVLEVDPRTRIIRRLELTRWLRGQRVQTTFTLLEIADQPNEQYQLTSHLAAGGLSFGPDQPGQRAIRLAGVTSALMRAVRQAP